MTSGGAVDALGIIGFALSVILGLLKIWETFFQRSNLNIHFDWIQHGGPDLLSFWVSNIGRRKDTVVEIRFGLEQTPAGEGWLPQRAVLERMPVILDVDVASPRFYILTQPNSTDAFDVALRSGEITKTWVVNAQGKTKQFQVPPLPAAGVTGR